MPKRAPSVWPNWRLVVDALLCVSGVVISVVTWPDIADCAVLYKAFLCIGVFVCVIDGTGDDFESPHDEREARSVHRCLALALLFVALAPTLFVVLPSTCAAPLPARAWVYAWQAAAVAYAAHFLRKAPKPPRKPARKPLIDTTQVL